MAKHYNLYGNRARWIRWLALFALGILVLLVIIASIFFIKYNSSLRPVSRNQTLHSVTIPTGTSADEIALILRKEGLIRSTWAFSLFIRVHHVRSDLQAGTYSLREDMTLPQIIAILSHGKIKVDLVTILPGNRLIDQVRQSLIDSGYSQTDVDQALNPEVYAGHPLLADKPKEASLEGYLYPESFQKTGTTTAQDVVRRSLDEMYKHLTIDVRNGFAKQGLNVHQGLTLASIIEREVSRPTDKAQVAQVFLKRLREGLPLGADATGIYGAVLAGQPPTIFFESAYNTHSHKGLTPTPISTVTDSSLQAVAHPASTDWLFFVSGDDGQTYFSKTLAEHEALTRAHCKKLCQQ